MRAGDGPSLSTMIVGAWPAKAILKRLFQGGRAEKSGVSEAEDKEQEKDAIVALNVPAGRGSITLSTKISPSFFGIETPSAEAVTNHAAPRSPT